jgi:hypothetical protein
MPAAYVMVSRDAQSNDFEVRARAAELTAVPAAVLSLPKRKFPKSKGRLVKDGEIYSKTFNEVASRPVPRNGVSLEQMIIVEAVRTATFLTTSTTVLVGVGVFDTVANYSLFAQMVTAFDQYKFLQLEFWIEPQTILSQSVAFSTGVDLDDASTPSTMGQVQNKQGALTGLGFCGHYHKFVPHMAVAVYSGAFTSFSNATADWIDSSSTGVQHYGVKGYSSPTSVATVYTMTIRAVVAFRAPGNQ